MESLETKPIKGSEVVAMLQEARGVLDEQGVLDPKHVFLNSHELYSALCESLQIPAKPKASFVKGAVTHNGLIFHIQSSVFRR